MEEATKAKGIWQKFYTGVEPNIPSENLVQSPYVEIPSPLSV